MIKSVGDRKRWIALFDENFSKRQRSSYNNVCRFTKKNEI